LRIVVHEDDRFEFGAGAQGVDQLGAGLARAVDDHWRPGDARAKAPAQKAAQQQPAPTHQRHQHQPADHPGRARHQAFLHEDPDRHHQQYADAGAEHDGIEQAFVGVAQDGPVQAGHCEGRDQDADRQREQPDHVLQHGWPPVAQADSEGCPDRDQYGERIAGDQQDAANRSGKIEQGFELHGVGYNGADPADHPYCS